MHDLKKAKLDAEALRTFVTVAQLRSFSAAGDLMHRTTSAISYRIKMLEDRVGTPLFRRTTRSVTLTRSGEVLLEKASQIFEWLERLPEELQQVNDGIEPHFTLVVNNLIYEANAISALVAHLTKRFPHVVIEVRRAVYMGVWDEMLHNNCNMALGVPGFHTISDDFVTEPLGVINWVFAVAPEHPLASAPGPLGDDQLRHFPVVNVQDTAERLAKRTAWRLAGQLELLVPDLETKIACHMQGLCVGFLPAPVAREMVQQRRLVERPVLLGRSPSPLALAWRRHGSGKISEYMRQLCTTRPPLMTAMFALLEPHQAR